MHHEHVLKKLNFDVLTLSPRVVGGGGGGGCRQIYASILLHFVITFNLIIIMQHDHDLQKGEF